MRERSTASQHKQTMLFEKDDDENDVYDDSKNYPLNKQISQLSSNAIEEQNISTRSPGPLSWPHANQMWDEKKGALRHLNIVAVRGIHYVEYAVGKPPQKVKLAVSLNGGFTVFRCSPYHDDCNDKECAGDTFNRLESNSFVKIGCDACSENDLCVNDRCLVQGEDWSAYRARDFVLTDEGSFDLSFGCQVSSGGFLDIIEGSGHGMIGLSSSPNSFVNQMYRSGIIESTTFSMCFRRYNNRNLDSAGTLTIGGYNSDFLTSPMVYMENTAINGKYSTIITNLYLRESGGESVTPFSESQKVVKLFFDKDAANSGPGTVIDTSYPGTLLNVAILNSLQNEWFVMTGRPYLDVPISLTEEEMLSLPTVLVQLKTSFTDNTFTDPNKVVGMVGDELDPISPQDVLLAIPATHYMLKEKNGMYKSMLSFTHENGSVLGANAFQGRHLLFRTGYSSANSYIGIAEAEKCAIDDNESDGLDDGPPRSTPSPTISSTSDPSRSDNQEVTGTNINSFISDGLFSWPILTGTGVLLIVVTVAFLCCYRRKRKKRKMRNTNTDESDDLVSAGGDSSSFISYGLRSHLFSLVSSKAGISEQRQPHQQYRSIQANQESNVNQSRPRNSTMLMDEEVREPLSQLEANNRLRYGHNNNLHDQLQEPILAQAQPMHMSENTADNSAVAAMAQAEPIVAIPHTHNHQYADQDILQQHGQHQTKNSRRRSGEYGGMEYPGRALGTVNNTQTTDNQATEWFDQRPTVGTPFLVRKGSMESSDDEDRTFNSKKSRKQARRQLELAAVEIATPMIGNRTEESSRPQERRWVNDVSRISGRSPPQSPSKFRRGDPRSSSRERRHTLGLSSHNDASVSNSRSHGRRNTMLTSSRERRRTMNMLSQNDASVSNSKSHGRRKSMLMGSTLDNRIAPSTRQSSNMQLNLQIDPITTTKGGGVELPNRRSSAELASSRMSSKPKIKQMRSTKASTLSNAARRDKKEFSVALPEIPSFRRVEEPPEDRPRIDEGTVIGMRENDSVISGLTDMGNIMMGRNPGSRGSMASSKTGAGKGVSSSGDMFQRRNSRAYYPDDRFDLPMQARLEGNNDTTNISEMSDGSISRQGSVFSKRSSGASRFDSVGARTYASKRNSHVSRRVSIGNATFDSRRSSGTSGRGSIGSGKYVSKHSTGSRCGTGSSKKIGTPISNGSRRRTSIGIFRNQPSPYESSSSDQQSFHEDGFTRDSNPSRNRRNSVDSSYISIQELDVSKHSTRRGSSRQQIDVSEHSRRSSAGSRRSSTPQQHGRRRSMMMSTIRELPSSKENFNETLENNPRNLTGEQPRSRNSLESFATLQLDREMHIRSLPAAPLHRIMPKENSRVSLW